MKDIEIKFNKVSPMINGEGPILVLDDDQSQLTLINACYNMSSKNNQLVLLQDEESLKEYFRKGKDFTTPELLLLDINIPKSSGFEVLKKIKRCPSEINFPIIIFSTSKNEQDKTMARKLGADGFLSKPFHIEEYIQFFNNI